MKDILVSLVIPAYNVEDFLPLTLNSVLNQTLSNFECIVVNDYSTDKTEAVIERYIEKDDRVKLISHRANAGLSAARNTGLRFARGKYIAFLDSDDLIMPESLELRAKTLEKSTADVVGTYSGTLTIRMDDKIPPEGKQVDLKFVDFVSTLGNCPFNANQPMFKTELFKKFGGFNQTLKQAEDYDMWLRILRQGFKIIPTNMQLVTYRQTEGSMIKRNPLLHLDNSFQLFSQCYCSYPVEKWNNRVGSTIDAGIDSYYREINISGRVLEFIGIGVAKGDSHKDLVERLYEYLPNYFTFLEKRKPFIPAVKRGMVRYFQKNIDLNSSEYKKFNDDINAIYNDFQSRVAASKITKQNKLNVSFNTNMIVGMPNVQSKIDVCFIPHKDYHVKEISLLAPFLKKNNVSFIVIDISMHYRNEGVKKACEEYNIPMIGYSNFSLGNFKPKALVVFNDWDAIVWSIIKRANESNIATIGIVEGVQDYDDMDTGRNNRGTYRTVKNVFIPGSYDQKYFQDYSQNVYVGGVSRIYEMFMEKKSKMLNKSRIALINSNFSYGVLIEHRDNWLTSAVNACNEAGYDPVVTRHPADQGELFSNLVTKKSFYEALDESTVLISRFGSGVLEAIAVNKPVIYFNPHEEKVDKFVKPNGAFSIIDSESALSNELIRLEKNFANYLSNFENYLKEHCGVSRNPSEVIAKIISTDILKDRSKSNFDKFFESLQELDHRSFSFYDIHTLREDKLANQRLLGDAPQDKLTSEVSFPSGVELIKTGQYKQAQLVLYKLVETNPSCNAYRIALDSVNMLIELDKS